MQTFLKTIEKIRKLTFHQSKFQIYLHVKARVFIQRVNKYIHTYVMSSLFILYNIHMYCILPLYSAALLYLYSVYNHEIFFARTASHHNYKSRENYDFAANVSSEHNIPTQSLLACYDIFVAKAKNPL